MFNFALFKINQAFMEYAKSKPNNRNNTQNKIIRSMCLHQGTMSEND